MATNGAKLLITLRPNLKSAAVQQFLGGIIMSSIPAVIVMVVYLLGVAIEVARLFMVMFLVLLIIAAFTFFAYMKIRARKYRIYEDKVEWYEGFINIKKIMIPFDRVTDVGFSKNIVDRFFSTGSLRLNTAGLITYAATMSYLDNPEKIEDMLKNLIQKNKVR